MIPKGVILNGRCPECNKVGYLTSGRECGIEFTEPVCAMCKSRAIHENSPEFDPAYERLIANGWAD